MKGQDLIEQYPKAISVVRSLIISRLKEEVAGSDSGITDEFISMIFNQEDKLLINMIDNSPHSLFEIFDINSIYISIIVRRTKDNNVLFNYKIIPRDKKNSSCSSKDRRIIESYAIEDAFEMLENSL